MFVAGRDDEWDQLVRDADQIVQTIELGESAPHPVPDDTVVAGFIAIGAGAPWKFSGVEGLTLTTPTRIGVFWVELISALSWPRRSISPARYICCPSASVRLYQSFFWMGPSRTISAPGSRTFCQPPADPRADRIRAIGYRHLSRSYDQATGAVRVAGAGVMITTSARRKQQSGKLGMILAVFGVLAAGAAAAWYFLLR